MSVAPGARFCLHPRVMLRQVADEAVLLHLDRGEYFALNSTGLRVWELASQGQPFAATVDMLQCEFEASREELAADAATLLGELQRAGLILLADSETPAGSTT